MKIIKMSICAIALMMLSCSESKSPQDLIANRTAKITEMAELGTVEYTISKIIKANDNKAFYTIGDRKILMSCKAVVKAGIDMRDFTEENVSYDKEDNSVSVTLPNPKILSLNIPAEDIKMEYINVGLLRSDFTAEERNKLLRQGEESIKKEIDSMGIIEDARINARMFVESMFSGLGVDNVYVKFAE